MKQILKKFLVKTEDTSKNCKKIGKTCKIFGKVSKNSEIVQMNSGKF